MERLWYMPDAQWPLWSAATSVQGESEAEQGAVVFGEIWRLSKAVKLDEKVLEQDGFG
jgi:hypothetical protein